MISTCIHLINHRDGFTGLGQAPWLFQNKMGTNRNGLKWIISLDIAKHVDGFWATQSKITCCNKCLLKKLYKYVTLCHHTSLGVNKTLFKLCYKKCSLNTCLCWVPCISSKVNDMMIYAHLYAWMYGKVAMRSIWVIGRWREREDWGKSNKSDDDKKCIELVLFAANDYQQQICIYFILKYVCESHRWSLVEWVGTCSYTALVTPITFRIFWGILFLVIPSVYQRFATPRLQVWHEW